MAREAGSSQQYQRIANLNPRRTAFPWTFDHRTTLNMGDIVPVFAVKTIPGDTWKLSHEIVVRLHPPAAPFYHEVNATIHYFDVPLRILWDRFERYYTGGKLGNDDSEMPRWRPNSTDFQKGSLWDYFGFPVNITPQQVMGNWDIAVSMDQRASYNYMAPPADALNLPTDLLRRAYNVIWDEYYRDVDLQDALNPDPNDPSGEPTRPVNNWGDNRKVLKRSWRKDYLTSARIDRQRGTPPALPIYGDTSVDFLGEIFTNQQQFAGTPNSVTAFDRQDNNVRLVNTQSGAWSPSNTVNSDHIRGWLNNNRVNLSSLTSADISDIRTAVQTQKWMERNMRGGSRFTEVIRAHFDESPTDERLDRPKYIGGSRHHISITEVVQTSSSDNSSPQGNMCGHGLCADEAYITEYRVKEPSIILGLISIMPKAGYEDGINRQWLSGSRFEEYWAEYAHLSEQGIYNCEVYPRGGNPLDAQGNPVAGGDLDLWGFQGRYDEYRVAHDYATSEMRVKPALVVQQRAGAPTVPFPSLGYWHLLRSFGERPGLNSDFIQCNPDRRWMAVSGAEGFEIDECIVNYHCKSVAVRPMPPIAEPGLMDHF